ncbi:hypothetical protein [Hydrogenophaga sp. 5NK40-0174]|uniref:hypothetical protein n=1 Tax=Hydrogenophaga sp. 5NK40-0174 TaxID=3127649 RepID=UPI0033410684
MSRRSIPEAQDQDGDALDINSRTMHQYYHTVVADSDDTDPIAEALLRRGQRLAQEKARRAQLRRAAMWGAGLLAAAALAFAVWWVLGALG